MRHSPSSRVNWNVSVDEVGRTAWVYSPSESTVALAVSVYVSSRSSARSTVPLPSRIVTPCRGFHCCEKSEARNWRAMA